MDILITICARGGSKGIPGKNIKLLNGLPLIGYTIQTAKHFAEKFSTVIALSTDSSDIQKVAAECGLKTDYLRPDNLATDTAGKIAVIEDLKKYEEVKNNLEFDFVIDLDITSPLRTVMDLENALDMLLHDEQAYNVFSVSPANRNPYFNMVESRNDGYVQLVKSGTENILSRQAAPDVYDMNASFYIFRKSFFQDRHVSSITNRSLAYVMSHTCFDLDHPMDFTIMELLLKNDKLDFDL
ncbi:acylneuraminate cytidylyltransferase family protein [Carboxylicivirga sediminis]|uniref:Acylneuraminate cytidylyltransferase family protein n=1 Tax=Carboxylicivirga sediminis TaxID=2006564 RepID=A0A941F8J9_9BACT|nr:acylneuraminate cytidylyltransferase family protein [Carboxylicivirga sediminis]MBR8537385.1 acylneuraminate cytidylyltransferase family protein [Carboxylicivirga sediminis]